ncbi:MAG: protein kinase, partial [Deltaproteobacteria bacterium]|nr:protein kinase [Deltaproteobacteria bacterium]
RFEREALIAARLQHPAIVPIYEAGTWEDGEPFFAMKLVLGRSLDAIIADRPELADRLALLPNVIAVTEALAYAHARGVIHRDLKPHNVLIGDYGETVVIDWGLAKAIDQRDVTDGLDARAALASTSDVSRQRVSDELTVAGAAMGTPAYMPPEQALGEEVGPRADVYALGAMLYHVLAGKRPYAPSLRRTEPAKSASDGGVSPLLVASEAPTPLAELDLDAPADLLTIVSKAMARDARDRYRDGGELAAELRRFTSGQLVSAHRYSAGALIKRWARRHRGIVVTAAVAALALGGFGGYSVRRIVRERDDAEAARQAAAERDERLAVDHARAIADADPTMAVASLAKLAPTSPAWPEVRSLLVGASYRGIARRVLRGHEHTPQRVLVAADRRVISAGPEGTIRIWDAAGAPVATLVGHRGNVADLAIAHDGARLASLGVDGTARLWRGTEPSRSLAPDGEVVTQLIGFTHDDADVVLLSRTAFLVCPVAGGPCRRLVPRAPGATHGVIRTLVDPTGRDVTTRSIETWTEHVRAVLSPTARIMLACDGGATGWDLDAGVERWIAPGSVAGCAVAPTGEFALVRAKEIEFVDAGSGARRGGVSTKEAQSGTLVVSPDGARLAFVRQLVPPRGQANLSMPWQLEIIDRATGASGVAIDVDEATQPIFTPTGDRVAWRESGQVRVAEVRGLELSAQWKVPGAREVGFSADGAQLVTGDVDGSVRVWSTRATRGARVAARDKAISLSASDDGATLGIQTAAHRLVAVTWRDGHVLADVALPETCLDAAISPDGRWAKATCGQEIEILRIADQSVRTIPGTASAWLAPDRLLTWRWIDPAITIHDLAGPTRVVELGTPTSWIVQLGVARAAGTIAVLMSSGELLFVDATTGVIGRRIAAPCTNASPIAVSWDGHGFACGVDRWIWSARDSGVTAELRGHFDLVTNLVFAADGQLISTASDGLMRRWQADGRSRAYTRDAATESVIAGANGAVVTSGAAVRGWDLATGTSWGFPLAATRGLPLGDGRSVALAGATEVVVFTDELPTTAENLAPWIQSMTEAARE